MESESALNKSQLKLLWFTMASAFCAIFESMHKYLTGCFISICHLRKSQAELKWFCQTIIMSQSSFQLFAKMPFIFSDLPSNCLKYLLLDRRKHFVFCNLIKTTHGRVFNVNFRQNFLSSHQINVPYRDVTQNLRNV